MSYTQTHTVSADIITKLLAFDAEEYKHNKGPEVDYKTWPLDDLSLDLAAELLGIWPRSEYHGAMLIKLPLVTGCIPEHTESCGIDSGDKGPWRKYHIPLQTNDQAVSWIDGTEYVLEVGNIYEIEFTKPHRSVNTGDSNRLHLVVEIYA